MRPISELVQQKPWLGWLMFLGTMVVVFLLGLLASSIVERRAEAVLVFTPKHQLSSYEPRNSVWGENYPREYQSYLKTSDTTFRSKHGGGAMIDVLEESPDLVILFAGYLFSHDYNQGRGHYYAIKDVYNSLRTGAPMTPEEGPQPGTCWTCKSSDVPRMMQEMGIEGFYSAKWSALGPEIVNPIGCADCHDPKTMNLRISRPALVEAYERMGKDINKASHQEMRSLVCAQCHVEYYFKGEGKYLTFPWDKGFSAEDMEAYFDEHEFTDWTHAVSKAPMVKAQHPDFEVFMTGIHAQRGVSCADCHMPYKSEGGQKFTDHKIQSPLNNISASCQVCHRQSEDELRRNVYERQDKIAEFRHQLEKSLVKAHIEAKTAWDLGVTEAAMKPVLKLIRQAQWRWDYVAASHGASVHSPVESARVLGAGMQRAQEARVELARILASLGHNKEVVYPDISTKAKAQAYIGLDIPASTAKKNFFLENVLPGWLDQAREREASY